MKLPHAFTLIETVLAIAIVAGTMLVVISVLSAQSNAIQDLRRLEEQTQQRDPLGKALERISRP